MNEQQLKIAFGDFQTPPKLAAEVCAFLRGRGVSPSAIIEPTCGVGNFVLEAAKVWPAAAIFGFEINPDYIAKAKESTTDGRVSFEAADFFGTDWNRVLGGLTPPILVLGNPPWVTNSAMTGTGSSNLPAKSNFQGDSGFDAITGKANFDISEWMILKMIAWCERRGARIAILVKVSVARKILLGVWKEKRRIGKAEMHRIDAKRWFGAAVDACLFTFAPSENPETTCAVYASLGGPLESEIGYRGGRLVNDVRKYESVAGLLGSSALRWRSGVKHDCSKVFELTGSDGKLANGYGEEVDIEKEAVFPLFKSSQLARGDTVTSKFVIITQRWVGQPTERLRLAYPQTWEYLLRHIAEIDQRGSSIYARGPRFSIFGVGEYTFAPWKVAISGLYKEPKFVVLGPLGGKPSIVDDTACHLSFEIKEEAEVVARALNSSLALEFFAVFAFREAKRPFTVDVLSQLDLARLVEKCGGGVVPSLVPETREVTGELFA